MTRLTRPEAVEAFPSPMLRRLSAAHRRLRRREPLSPRLIEGLILVAAANSALLFLVLAGGA